MSVLHTLDAQASIVGEQSERRTRKSERRTRKEVCHSDSHKS